MQQYDRVVDEVHTMTQALREALNNLNLLCKEILDHHVQIFHNGGYLPVNVPAPRSSKHGSGQVGIMPAGFIDFRTVETHDEEIFKVFQPPTPRL